MRNLTLGLTSFLSVLVLLAGIGPVLAESERGAQNKRHGVQTAEREYRSERRYNKRDVYYGEPRENGATRAYKRGTEPGHRVHKADHRRHKADHRRHKGHKRHARRHDGERHYDRKHHDTERHGRKHHSRKRHGHKHYGHKHQGHRHHAKRHHGHRHHGRKHRRHDYRGYTYNRGGCVDVSRVGWWDGQKALIGGVGCYDDYGNLFVLEGSRYLIQYYY